ncbi:Tyrosine recombinase XerC [bioreactor metagenome]|uniref:Tyrosine recombinase XerC n=1 Tax=bioreactor metagenome TaxID=1076179 RepID=A0A644ZWI1_9ZZZZ
MNGERPLLPKAALLETWKDAMEDFISLRKAEGAAPRTIQGYRENIGSFFKKYPTAWEGTCRKCLLHYLSQEGISPATYNARLKVLHPFFRFCVSEGVFPFSPAEGLKYRREEARIIDHSIDAIKKLLSVMEARTFTGTRDRALFLFSLDTGARPGETLQMRPSDIDLRERKAIIRPATSKTRTGRSVFFSRETAAALLSILAFRKKEWNDSVPLFCARQGTPWNSRAWTGQLSRYAKKAGLPRFSAYDIRHQHAITFLRNGGNLMTLQREMGHTDLEMTRRYLAITEEDIRKDHEKASPVTSLLTKEKGVKRTPLIVVKEKRKNPPLKIA